MVNVIRRSRVKVLVFLMIVLGGPAFFIIDSHPAFASALTRFSLFISPTSGQEQYMVYCAGCHGEDGRGKGRSSRYCSAPPTDLTQLAHKNRGTYPAERVCNVLHQGTGHTPKGRGYMPTWEPLLKSMNGDPPGVTEVRIQNLTDYVKTLQEITPAPEKRATPAR